MQGRPAKGPRTGATARRLLRCTARSRQCQAKCRPTSFPSSAGGLQAEQCNDEAVAPRYQVPAPPRQNDPIALALDESGRFEAGHAMIHDPFESFAAI